MLVRLSIAVALLTSYASIVPARAGAALPAWAWGSCTVSYPRAAVPGVPSTFISIERVTLNPGQRTAPHAHHTAEYLTVISGVGKISIAGRPAAQIRPATTIAIAPGTTQAMANASATGAQLVYIAAHVGSRRNEDFDEARTTCHESPASGG